jgi:hypothetical protein
MEIPNFVEEVTRLLIDAKDNLEASVFTTGPALRRTPRVS